MAHINLGHHCTADAEETELVLLPSCNSPLTTIINPIKALWWEHWVLSTHASIHGCMSLVCSITVPYCESSDVHKCRFMEEQHTADTVHSSVWTSVTARDILRCWASNGCPEFPKLKAMRAEGYTTADEWAQLQLELQLCSFILCQVMTAIKSSKIYKMCSLVFSGHIRCANNCLQQTKG